MSEEKMTIKQMWQAAPDDQLDKGLQDIVGRWDDSPTPIQILELLDAVIHGGAGSGFTVSALQLMYSSACAKNEVKHEEVVQLATWRKEHAHG